MKKTIFTSIAALLLILAGCGEKSEEDNKKTDSAPTVCDCVKAGEEMSKEMTDAGDDETKFKEIEEKFKEKMEDCKKLAEGLTDEEMKKLEEEARNCK